MGEKQIRVLQVHRDLKKGGVQSEIMWPTRILPHEVACFDALLFSSLKGYYDEEFERHGSIFRIVPTERTNRFSKLIGFISDPFLVYKRVNELLKSQQPYDAVHCHDMSFFAPVLMAARKNAVPVRVAHSSINKPIGANRDKAFVALYFWICSKVLSFCATSRLGVTQNAADYMFGKGNGRVIKNPTLDLTSFNPTRFSRENSDVLSLIMVGSISPRKNQDFAIEIVREIRDLDQKCKLVMIGYQRSEKEGYLPKLNEKIDNYKLNDAVEFLPQDSDIPYFMSQSDFLLMPSLQEGLPNTALEAQAMGLSCVISTDVSKDCDCGLCTFLPRDKGAQYWANYLLKEFRNPELRNKRVDMSDWDNRKICQEYLELWRGNIR